MRSDAYEKMMLCYHCAKYEIFTKISQNEHQLR